MEEETDVVELRREARVEARANLLWMYLNQQNEDEELRLTQAQLCKALAVGTDGRHLREALSDLEHRGKLVVNRSFKPHRYTLNQPN